MSSSYSENSFIDYLYSLVGKDQRRVLADLRRGLGEEPGTVPVMFPHITQFVPDADRNTWREKVYYLVASLFAYYHSGGSAAARQIMQNGNLGDHLYKALDGENLYHRKALEARFSALLAAHPENLPFFLLHVLSLLKSREISVCWGQLFSDLQAWEHPDRYVQRNWANAYWRSSAQTEDKENETAEIVQFK